MLGLETGNERNLDGYGAPMIEWAQVREALATQPTQAPDTGGPNRHTAWLTTNNPDRTPHVRPLGLLSAGSGWYFASGRGTRKSRNLARDPRCAISIAIQPFDLVVEGRAEPVADPAALQAVADAYVAGGWPACVQDDALTADFSAPSAGPPPWHVYRLVPTTVYAFGTAEPYGAARFDIAGTGAHR